MRARYWREAWTIYENSPTVGAGAGAYATARTRYRDGSPTVRHAHGYGVQTLADLGRVGLAIFAAWRPSLWILAAMRATGLRRRDRGQPFDPERIGLLTMAVVVVVFGVHSLIDWTWFVPGNAVRRRCCAPAGWPGARPARAAARGATRRSAHGVSRGGARRAVARRGRRGGPRARVVTSWAALQPVRSAHAEDAALDRAQLGKYGAAAREGAHGGELNPLSVDPLWQLAFIDDARGDTQGAKRSARGRDAPPARERRGVAAARALPALGARRPGGGGRGLPARVLPRPAPRTAGLGLPRGLARAQGQG